MVPLLVQLIVVVLIIFALIWAVQRLGAAFTVPAQIVVVIEVVIVLAFVLWALTLFSGRLGSLG